jgi:hypothetical protein
VPYYICPRCKERSVDIDAREGFSRDAPACRHCGFGFLFELLDDYYPAPDTGMVVTDQERRVLAIGRGVFELTGFGEPDLIGRDVVDALQFSDAKPVDLAREWGVRRLSQRLGFTKQEDPVKIERDLVRLVPREDWARFPHLLIWHGRRVCIARLPRCEDCVVNDLCPSSRV